LGSGLVASGKVADGNRHLASARELDPDSAMLRTQQAIGQLAAGDLDAALRDLQVIAGEGARSNADVLLVYLHAERGDFDAALQAANALIAKQPDDATGYNLRGVVHTRQKDLTAAREDFDRALRANSKFAPAAINLGYLDRSGGNIAAAKKRFEQAIEIDSSNVNSYLALAEIAAAEQDSKTAIALLEQAIANNVAAVQPRLMLASYQLAIGNVEKALQLLAEAVRYAPGNPQAKFMLGEAQIAAKDLAAAKASFEALAIERPQAVEVKLQLAAIALAEQQPDRAKSLIDEALALEPKNPQALAVLVRLNIASGDHARARSIAQRIKELLPENNIGDLLLGDALLAARDARGAIASYEKAAAISPTTVTTQRLFEAVQQSGDAARATAILDEWLLAHPGDLAIRNTRASLDLVRGDNAAAIARYEAVLKEAPNDVIALNNLAYLAQATDRKKALSYAERAYQLAPNAAEVVDTYGWILVQQDKVSQGLELLRKAAASGNPDIRYHLAAALAKAGSRDEARGVLEAILAEETAFNERRAAESLHALLR
jgi:putative PEP-CTERM system TPR-repeat lipoprotein